MHCRQLLNSAVANTAVLCTILTCRTPRVIAAYLSGYSLENFAYVVVAAETFALHRLPKSAADNHGIRAEYIPVLGKGGDGSSEIVAVVRRSFGGAEGG
ncbi:hypothetical protein AXF42_Ash020344 [Apostasia shenzhenica]|uniref:Uncharacterized protein n=1 Tax=Apostasia shenzhenica TaxID=1088818 RepID=A0A2I0B0Q8_9ASPA|nr:hypothetical protein AXF42_Ash020344 [Apostasia shenzhenica]